MIMNGLLYKFLSGLKPVLLRLGKAGLESYIRVGRFGSSPLILNEIIEYSLLSVVLCDID